MGIPLPDLQSCIAVNSGASEGIGRGIVETHCGFTACCADGLSPSGPQA